MIKLELQTIISEDQSKVSTHTVYLLNKELRVIVPIKMDQSAVNNILLAKSKKFEPRPSIHNTTTRIIKALKGNVDSVILSNYGNDVFYSYIRIVRNNKSYDIDAKPSDAFAIALRLKRPIYATENVIEQAGVRITKEMVTN